MKSKHEISLELIAGIEGGLEQDIAELERWWPKSKRGSNATRAFSSLISRARFAAKEAREALS
jgi:hypothetical protein